MAPSTSSSDASFAPASTMTMPLLGAGDDDVQLGALLLLVGGVGDDTCRRRGRRARPPRTCSNGNVGDGQRGGGADDGQRGGVGVRSGRKHHADDLRLAGVAFREQRADRAVDHGGREDFPFAGAPFALDEAAGNPSGGVGVLTVIDREREESSLRPSASGSSKRCRAPRCRHRSPSRRHGPVWPTSPSPGRGSDLQGRFQLSLPFLFLQGLARISQSGRSRLSSGADHVSASR